jgi:hypothetical protein
LVFHLDRYFLLNDKSLRSESLAVFDSFVFHFGGEFYRQKLRGECSHSTRQNIDNNDFRDKKKDRNKWQAVTTTIYQLGFRCGQTTAQPATAAVRLDRNEARNPQLYIVPSVITHLKSK